MRDQSEVRLHPVQAIEAVIAFVGKHTTEWTELGRVYRTELWTFPRAAVPEASINAVVHADYALRGAPIRVAIYDDWLESENPGLLPFGLTVDDVERGFSMLRNRVIGRVFNELGLVEQWGSRIQRMIAACKDAGSPPPRFEEIGARFRVTIYSDQVGPPRLDDMDRQILDQLADGKAISTKESAELVGLSTRATRTRLARLVELRLLSEVGTGPEDPRRRYYLATCTNTVTLACT